MEAQFQISSNPPVVVGAALVLPQGLVDEALDRKASPEADPEVKKRVELLAMKAVMEAETALGNQVKDVSREKCGWDVTSVTPSGATRHIEVKGRRAEADTVTVTANEILEALNQGGEVLPGDRAGGGEKVEGPHYVRAPFAKEPEGSVVSVNYSVKDFVARGRSAGMA